MKSSLLIFNSIILFVFVLMGNTLAQTHSIDGEYIKEWLVLGPFLPDNLEMDFLADIGGEVNIESQEGDTVTTVQGDTLTWKRYTTESNSVNLLDAVGYHENATAYAFGVLQMREAIARSHPEYRDPRIGGETAGDAEIRFGNAGAAAVWLDGKLVHRNPSDGYVILDKHRFDVNLPIGKIPCLIKVARQNWDWGWDWGFAMRVLPPNRAVIEGTISSEKGNPIPNAVVQLEQSGVEITQTQTDASGSYRVSVYPAHGRYDLSVTANELGAWQLGLRLQNGDRRTLNLILKEAISISGTLLMLDDATPHVSVPVQALIDERVIATTLSDENGEYQFINLKPGQYQLRCQVLGGYVYYETTDYALPFTFYDSPDTAEDAGKVLSVEQGRNLTNIDFRFPPFKKGTWKSYTYIDGLVNNEILAIYQDPKGAMWLGTWGGVSKYDGKEFVNFTTKNGLPSNIVSSIQRDQDGLMWFGTQGGVSRYDGKTFVNFTQEDGLTDNWVTSIYAAADGMLWFGTYGGGVSSYDGETFINLTPKDGLADNRVFAIYGATDGILWFGTYGGVSRYDGKEFVNFTAEDGLAHNRVFAIHGSTDGVLWFGTYGGGVSRYNGKEFNPLEKGTGKIQEEFITFTTKDGLPNNVVSSIHRDRDGVMWFGTQGGVSRYDGRTFVNFTSQDGLTSGTENVIYRDSNGVMWFGGRWRGLSRYDEKGLVAFTTKDGLAANDVNAFYTAPDGVMWLGSGYGGISEYEGSPTLEAGVRGGKKFVTFTTKDGLPSNKVLSIHRDPDSVMWFGTRDGGVSRYDGEKFVNFTAKDGLAHNPVATICDDSDGMLWFGTWGSGVSRYDGKKFVTFTTKDGLPDNSVCSIHHGPEGNLWFGTSAGVSTSNAERS